MPRLASRHGLKVLLGIWVGRTAGENEDQLARAVGLARKYGSSIEAIVVGNEVLLRGEQPSAVLRSYIERVKAAVPGVPVTYADVWEFWLQHRDLAEAVDFVTVHILPYWEDRPVAIEDAVGHVSHVYRKVVAEMEDREVFIGETGWPSHGRQRQGAEPSLVNQARFVREFVVRAEHEKIRYNVIEAFDQPWKRTLEGAVGGYWGLYDRLAAPKFAFRGPVAEAAAWSVAAIGVMGGFVAAFLWRRRGLSDGIEALALLLVSIATGGAFLGVWQELWLANRSLTEWAVTGAYAVFMLITILLVGNPLVSWCADGRPMPRIAPASHVLRWLRRNDQSYDGTARALGALRIAFLFGAAFVCLLLGFDPRYRDFPVAFYAVPAIGFALMAWINAGQEVDVEEIVLAAVIAVGSPVIAASEHLVTPRDGPWSIAEAINRHALGWSGLCLVLAGSVLVPVIAQLRTGQRQDPQQKPDRCEIPRIEDQPRRADHRGKAPHEPGARDRRQ